jgi:hypothetical protein
MDQAAEKLGGSFYILPSSIHEILLVKDNGQFDRASLEKMVREVNATQVAPEDKLTDSVYHYDSKNKVFELGEKFVERQKEAENVVEASDKTTVGDHNISTPDKETVPSDVGKGDAKIEAKAEAKSAEAGEKKSLLAQLRADKAEIAKEPHKDAIDKGVKSKSEAAIG